MFLNSSTILNLPIDLLIEILSKLPISEIAQFCQTNPHLNAICQNNRLWTSKFLNDFPMLNINEYNGDLYSYMEVYKSLIKPLSIVKDISQTNGCTTYFEQYVEQLGTVYLSFMVQEERLDNFANRFKRYLTPTSVIVMINSDYDPLIIGAINGDGYDWYLSKNPNKKITEVFILDTEDFKRLNRSDRFRLMKLTKETIVSLSDRYNLEQARAHLAQKVENESRAILRTINSDAFKNALEELEGHFLA